MWYQVCLLWGDLVLLPYIFFILFYFPYAYLAVFSDIVVREIKPQPRDSLSSFFVDEIELVFLPCDSESELVSSGFDG